MKTQFSFTKSGFTMFEIVVVISIIGILFASISRFTLEPQENIAKAERLASKVQSIIHSSNVSLMLWRMDQSTVPMATTGAIIKIYASWATSSGNSIYWQLAPTLSGKLVQPFYNDNDRFYQIESIKGCVGWSITANSWITNTAEIRMTRGSISFTWSFDTLTALQIEALNILEINVRYMDMGKKVIFDRRTGRTEIRRSWEDMCD